MIDKNTIDRIFAAANIVEVVGDFVSLRKKGVNYQACCPFHNEKTPSFVVSPTKGLFKCFGCGKGGNTVTFVMEHENLSYPDALKYVARKYGIEVAEREMSEEDARRNDDRESMMVLNSWASDYFAGVLHRTDEGRNIGLSYFLERGFTEQTVKKFGLGYCPSGGDTFTREALAEGYREDFLIKTGLSIKRESGGYYDRFSTRVIFPIHAIGGRVTAFGGRTMRTDKNTAKYLNSPESEVYHKSNVLYGLYFAKREITRQDRCILVEGYTDVISMHQSGVENVVASSGTALTEEQIRLIGRFTRNITVIYDGDNAGIKASLRGIDMILREGMNVRVILLPAGEDPDSFARSHNAAQLQEFILNNEEDFISFKTRILLADSSGDPLKKAALVNDIVESISVIPDAITRSIFIQECSRTMEVDEKTITHEVAMKRIGREAGSQAREFVRRNESFRREEESAAKFPTNITAGSSISELERELVRYILKYGDKNFNYLEGKESVELNVADIIISDLERNGIELADESHRLILSHYKKLRSEEREVGMHNFINHHDPQVCSITVDILTSDDNYIVSKLWEKFDIVVESELDRLSIAIPRAIILYKSKVIEKIITELRSRLAGKELSDEDMAEVTHQIAALNQERILISRKLSRLIL